jgi:hypothetical protein
MNWPRNPDIWPGTTDFETIKNRIVPSYAQSDTGGVYCRLKCALLALTPHLHHAGQL